MTFGPDDPLGLVPEAGQSANQNVGRLSDRLKQMQQLESEERFRQADVRIFAVVRLGRDWFNERGVMAHYSAMGKGTVSTQADLILTKADEAKWQGMLDDNGYYMEGVKFFFDANKMGLLDPDSLTQKYSDVTNKYKDGQVLFAQFPWVSSAITPGPHVRRQRFRSSYLSAMSKCLRRVLTRGRPAHLVHWRENEVSGPRDAIP